MVFPVANSREVVKRPLNKTLSRLVLPVLVLVWLGVAGIGLSRLWEYGATPGEAGFSPWSWPVESRIERNVNLPTLLMFAHPHCPCTRASIGELELVMTHCAGRVDARGYLTKPLDRKKIIEMVASDYKKTKDFAETAG